MKFLHVIASVNPASGGPIEGVKQIATVLEQQGHSVHVCCVDAPEAPWVQGFPFRLFPQGPSHLGYCYSSRIGPWLRENAMHYDVVIVNGIWQFPSFITHRILRGSQTPYFVFTHGMLDPWFKRTYPLKHLKKMLYWPWGEYPVLRDAAAVLFTCEEEKILARESFWPYRCNEQVVNYGTASPTGDPAQQRQAFFAHFPQLAEKRLFLFLSRIHAKKGCDLLLKAFARIADQDAALHLVMAGPDQSGWQPQLERLAQSLGIAERITWTGMLQGDLKWGVMHAAELFVLPSHQENFGIAVAEAMACGVPVLISNKVNIWREIEADGAGIVANDDVEGTEASLRRWLHTSEQEKKDMGRNALACFTQRFEINEAAESLVSRICSYR